jgi:hypothetical protein
MSASFKYITSDRDRVCKICGDKMARNTWGICLQNCHVSPKIVDIHFHEGCFFRSLEAAKQEYGRT